MTDKLIIFDTTLRDGEQSPGASMTRGEKMRIARALEKLRVDVIEAGFPIASGGDFEAVRSVAEIIKDSTVCALARTGYPDVDAAAQALKPATLCPHPYVYRHFAHTYGAQVDDAAGRGGRGRGKGGKKGKKIYRRRRVFTGGCGSLRARFPVPDHRGGHRRRRHYHQHPGHGGLQHSHPVRGNYRQYYRTCTQFRQGGVFGTLPQRPGACSSQFPGRSHARRPAGGVHPSTGWESARGMPPWKR